jgi:membrane associated rhomboid family serine protease
MLEDRSYMRGRTLDPQASATFALMAVNTAIFVIQSVLEVWFPSLYRTYFSWFALSTTGLGHGWIWQLATFQFMHAGLWHLIANLIAIYFFGRAIEAALGKSSFLKLYLACGVIGGLCQILMAVLFPRIYGGAVVGASAGAFGLVAAFATMFPEQTLTLLLFFVIPVTMRAKTLLWLSLALAVFGILVPLGSVAESAHLGGLLTGVAYIKWIASGRLAWQWPALRLPRFGISKTPPAKPHQKPAHPGGKPLSDAIPESAEFISREVDPILDKISAHGIHSLTERERRILEAARSRMAKR